MGTGAKWCSSHTVWLADWKEVVSMVAVAFWLFIGAEYVIPVSKNVKNAKRNVPLGMMIGLALDLSGTVHYGTGLSTTIHHGRELEASAAPHLLYGENLLGCGRQDLDDLCSSTWL